MFDKDTVTVSYDPNMGEPRGPRSKRTDYKAKGLGTCIDCYMCVQVCPTGIDIRNGLQYECINCGACVDACNDVMDKMNYPRGLIRFTTERNLEGGRTRKTRFKAVGYFVVMVIMATLLVWDISTRKPLEVDILRDRNQLYSISMEGWVQNVYTLKILNKSQLPQTFTIEAQGFDRTQLLGTTEVTIDGGSIATVPVTLAVHPDEVTERVQDIYFVVSSTDGTVTEQHQTSFLYE